MNAKSRLLITRQCRAKRRQSYYRAKQADIGKKLLQVRISKFAHHKAELLAERKSIYLKTVYETAIAEANLDALPTPHLEVCEGELIGTKAISPWVSEECHNKFTLIAELYPKSILAISAIVNDYCDAQA